MKKARKTLRKVKFYEDSTFIETIPKKIKKGKKPNKIVDKCIRCKKRKVPKYHHFLCDVCWLKQKNE